MRYTVSQREDVRKGCVAVRNPVKLLRNSAKLLAKLPQNCRETVRNCREIARGPYARSVDGLPSYEARPPLLLPPLSQVLQLLRLPLLTVALREHRRARRAPGHDARLLFRVLLPRRLGCKCCSFSCTTACPSPSP